MSLWNWQIWHHLKEGFHFYSLVMSDKCLGRCFKRSSWCASHLNDVRPELLLACEKFPKMFVVLQWFDWNLSGQSYFLYILNKWFSNIVIFNKVFIVGLSKLSKPTPAALFQRHLDQVWSNQTYAFEKILTLRLCRVFKRSSGLVIITFGDISI